MQGKPPMGLLTLHLSKCTLSLICSCRPLAPAGRPFSGATSFACCCFALLAVLASCVAFPCGQRRLLAIHGHYMVGATPLPAASRQMPQQWGGGSGRSDESSGRDARQCLNLLGADWIASAALLLTHSHIESC